ncbi:MAG: GNAT family N-acetyltransferase [Geminicoccaceae bacterium]
MLNTVRAWRAQDRDAVLALNTELQEHERALRPSLRPGPAMTEAYVTALEARLARVGEDGALLVAEGPGGQVLGFATCFVDEDELEREPRLVRIEDVVVARAARRQGIARALLAEASRFAGRHGIRRVVLSVLALNAEAAAAYHAAGFRPVKLTLERWLDEEEAAAP